MKFAINDIDIVITFADVNMIDVDTLIVPFCQDSENKTMKKVSRFFSFNVAEVTLQ